MRIMLVLPAARHLAVANNRGKVPKRAMKRFSILPLTTVAGLTPSCHEVSICDENVQELDLDTDVDLVGISFMTATAKRAYQIAAELRRRGKIVVAGGYHPTLATEDAAQHFDAVVAGDAEGAWLQLLADAEAGRLRRVYQNRGSCTLEQLPLPRRDLIGDSARHYVTTAAVQAGRGCSHGCSYCSITAFHCQSYRCRPVDEVIDEVRQLPRDFMFVDDNIIADPDYARALFTALAPLHKRWVSQCSLSIADDPELLALARQSGCQGLFIGIETIDDENLAVVGKGINRTARYMQQIDVIHGSGIGIVAGMIVGMDRDDTGVFERTLRFLQKAGIECLQLNIMTPLPGTPLYQRFESAGRITDRDLAHYDFRHYVIRPARMTGQELQDGADWLYRQFYRLDRVMIRTLRTLLTVGVIPAVLAWRLNRTYRYDNRREQIIGRNPAAGGSRRHTSWRAWRLFGYDPSHG
jgi:radical SAM superfamily enzyme YgiQ (UPF0313 family)